MLSQVSQGELAIPHSKFIFHLIQSKTAQNLHRFQRRVPSNYSNQPSEFCLVIKDLLCCHQHPVLRSEIS